MANLKKGNPLLIILLILSLILNGYLYYCLTQKSNDHAVLTQEIEALTSRVETMEALEESLNRQMDETLESLNDFQGLSSELDSLLEDAKKEIAVKQSRVWKLQKDAKKDKTLNEQLKKELAELLSLKENYLEQIDSLIQTNNLLQTQVFEYRDSVQRLEMKIQKGSVLSSDNITTIAYKQKKSGKFSTTVIASKTKRIEICFDIAENKITKSGDKEVFLRVIGPDGVTLGVNSGSFKVKDDNTENRYTSKALINYENQKKNYCVDYIQDHPFQNGNYQVEVYTDGFFSGVGAFILK